MAIQPEPQPNKAESNDNLPVKIVLGFVGGIVGGVVAFFIFRALQGIGLYALVLPGAFVGLGCGFAARHGSVIFSWIALVIGVIATLLTEWATDRFVHDNGDLYSLWEYTADLIELRGWFVVGVIALNGVIAFWLGRRG